MVLRKSFTSVCRSSADILVMFFFNFILGFVNFSSALSRLLAKILQTFRSGVRSLLNIIMCDSLSHGTLVCHYYIDIKNPANIKHVFLEIKHFLTSSSSGLFVNVRCLPKDFRSSFGYLFVQ